MPRDRRLAKAFEREVGKLFSTLGYKEYGKFFWDLGNQQDTPTLRPSRDPLKDTLLNLLLEQSRHDPAILSCGASVVCKLPQCVRTLQNIWKVSSRRLFDSTSSKADVVVVLDTLDPCTLDDLTAIWKNLTASGARSALVIVAKGHSVDLANLPNSLRVLNFVFWLDHYKGSIVDTARLLALYINTSDAPIVICIQTAAGLEMLGSYGQALSNLHNLFVLFAARKRSSRFEQVYNLRRSARFATVVTRTDAEASLMETFLVGLPHRGLKLLQDSDGKDQDRATFGQDFSIRRSPVGAGVMDALLAPESPNDRKMLFVDSPGGREADVSVVALFHGERELALPALASLRDMVSYAVSHGLRVETKIVLDNGDEETRRLILEHAGFATAVLETSFGDPALARNFAVSHCNGRFLTFLDGDDLWGKNWLLDSFRIASQSPASAAAIWHCDVYMLFYGSDCNRANPSDEDLTDVRSSFVRQLASDDPDFERRDLLLESLWTVNTFATKEIYVRFPYRQNDFDRQMGVEDWRWNLETLGHGLVHRIVPDTIHFIRVKEEGSLGQMHEAKKLLPVLL